MKNALTCWGLSEVLQQKNCSRIFLSERLRGNEEPALSEGAVSLWRGREPLDCGAGA